MKLMLIFLCLTLSSCAILKPATQNKYGVDIKGFDYIHLPATSTVSGSTGYVMPMGNSFYGASHGKSVNPTSIIEGFFLKNGITRVEKVDATKKKQTLILRYGESGKRNVMGGLGGYTLEVTIKILSAENERPVYFCTAEGQGETEADDIREAIDRCLSGLFS